MATTVLGIDPGTRKMGYGVIQVVGNNDFIYVGSGCIHCNESRIQDRLLTIMKAIETLLEQFSPDEMAIEEVFVSLNPQSTIKLAESRAVAMVVGARAGLDVYEYTPMQIKQAVACTGGADKKQVQAMVRRLLYLNSDPQIDASDALACALCHAYTRRIRSVMGPGATIATSSRGRGRTGPRSSWRNYQPS
ncbi:crossover junction endodeoxyribonuclease RuvC [Anaerobiospirillum sp. NML120449]|uniref:crossover junction endodeoxyribonuclease RuvC n=1 Tax=Anaerobiospirillum sp. NML120449 TaxID=2932817 RepID=UPI001FF5804C|nr:crossover junction endodeoxyribonuclease RuvC [Anaerobiospirillum sp. NML120449]MCK0525654.1 crossover junction endodeoxyribonuclease RuvC [Anaerobiospirillum sp. NML120449]